VADSTNMALSVSFRMRTCAQIRGGRGLKIVDMFRKYVMGLVSFFVNGLDEIPLAPFFKGGNCDVVPRV